MALEGLRPVLQNDAEIAKPSHCVCLRPPSFNPARGGSLAADCTSSAPITGRLHRQATFKLP